LRFFVEVHGHGEAAPEGGITDDGHGDVAVDMSAERRVES
jgi:hypothetical protein